MKLIKVLTLTRAITAMLQGLRRRDVPSSDHQPKVEIPWEMLPYRFGIDFESLDDSHYVDKETGERHYPFTGWYCIACKGKCQKTMLSASDERTFSKYVAWHRRRSFPDANNN